MKEIDTNRCLLRNWNEKDLSDLQEIFCAEEIAYLAGFKVKTPDEVLPILQTFIQDSKKSLWAIADRNSDKAIGWLEVHRFQEFGEKAYEIGYCLNESYWGKGIMPEVVSAVIKEMRESGEIEELVCSHFEHNKQSKRVIEKCGFHYCKKENGKIYYVQEIKKSNLNT